MSSKFRYAMVAGIFFPIAAVAQQPSTASPADPAAPAKSVAYQSVFTQFRAANLEADTPDAQWRAANEQVGALGGHTGHMKDTNTPGTALRHPRAQGATSTPSTGMGHSQHHAGRHP